MQATRTVLTALIVGLSVAAPVSSPLALAQDATPTAAWSCDDVATMQAGTPSPMMGGMSGMEMGTAPAGVDHMTMEIDQMYIDMMIPHHASIIAMAQAALPGLQDERLREIAQAVVATQEPEIAELRGYREQFYGDPEPMPMDDAMMTAMTEMMPGMSGTMEEMAFQMDAVAQVAVICAAENTDLAFIDLTIPHHRMAIEASQAVIGAAAHPEIGDVAQRVIDAQQREIETLTEIRQDLAGAGTPVSS
jgi:uncharacterized protein (DUF305 family)